MQSRKIKFISKTKIKTYTKSVSSLSPSRVWKTKALFFMPSKQAVSGELANMRPTGLRLNVSTVSTGFNYPSVYNILCF